MITVDVERSILSSLAGLAEDPQSYVDPGPQHSNTGRETLRLRNKKIAKKKRTKQYQTRRKTKKVTLPVCMYGKFPKKNVEENVVSRTLTF